jgi:undecaprenyl-diphosphatase
VPHLVEVQDLSFPSGHAMLSAVTYLTLAALLSRAEQYRSTRIFLLGTGIVLTLMIGLSRIYLGVHYPTDVLGGWCAGALWAAACWMIARRYISARPS